MDTLRFHLLPIINRERDRERERQREREREGEREREQTNTNECDVWFIAKQTKIKDKTPLTLCTEA